MDRSNHYEAAFEAYLHWHRLGYVAVDESRRTVLDGIEIKNLDFIVFGAAGGGLLVDVKGRRFPSGKPGRPRRVWECWSTEDDVEGLGRWAERFGPDFIGLLVFAYELGPDAGFGESAEVWAWRDRRYLFRGVAVEDYRPHMRPRSRRWGTVALPNKEFRELARPFWDFVTEPRAAAEECPF